MNNGDFIAIIGTGVTGTAVLRLLLAMGVRRSNIVLFDHTDPSADTNDPLALRSKYPVRTLVVSPGVPLQSEWLQDFKKTGLAITSELEIAFSYLEKEKVIGITGSVGKSTTTSILQAGAQAFSPNSFVGGNLGTPLAIYVAEVLEGTRPRADWVILELSSYQLENFSNLSCHYSAITYLTPNHMERYSSLDEYYNVKWGLLKKTKGRCVLNENGGDLLSFATSKNQNINKSSKCVWTDASSDLVKKYSLLNSALVGQHNLDNLVIATKLAELAGWPNKAFAAMLKFPGLPHRLENLGKHSGILFINDSKATTIESSQQAALSILNSLEESQRLWLLLGGKDKNLPWERLSRLASYKNLNPVFFGAVASKAKSLSCLSGDCYKNLGAALLSIKATAKPDDVVLLSPGGTSLDEFKNFEQRGEFFKSEILKHW